MMSLNGNVMFEGFFRFTIFLVRYLQEYQKCILLMIMLSQPMPL